jgi:hypothetical protein
VPPIPHEPSSVSYETGDFESRAEKEAKLARLIAVERDLVEVKRLGARDGD